MECMEIICMHTLKNMTDAISSETGLHTRRLLMQCTQRENIRNSDDCKSLCRCMFFCLSCSKTQNYNMGMKCCCTNFILTIIWILVLPLVPLIVLIDIVYNCCLGVKQIYPWSVSTKGLARYDLLDVRSKGEFDWFHIKDAKLFENTNINGLYNNNRQHKDIIVICMSGHRSPYKAYQLQNQSPNKKVYNLYGGMLLWKLCCKSVEY
eukprot:946109_1